MSCQRQENVIEFCHGITVLQGVLTSFQENGGDAMKNHFDFGDLMNFGLFLLALLTFVFSFCK